MTSSSRARGLLPGVAILLACLVVAGAGAATAGAATVPVKGGQAVLTTDQAQSFVDLWGANAVFMPVAPSTIAVGDADFVISSPAAGGSIDPAALRGTVGLKGGFLILSKQTMSAWTTLELTRVQLVLGSSAKATGLWQSGARKTFATLDLSGATKKTSWSNGSKYLTVSGVKATMTPWYFSQLKTALPAYDGPSHELGTYKLKLRIQ